MRLTLKYSLSLVFFSFSTCTHIILSMSTSTSTQTDMYTSVSSVSLENPEYCVCVCVYVCVCVIVGMVSSLECRLYGVYRLTLAIEGWASNKEGLPGCFKLKHSDMCAVCIKQKDKENK
jgi:hypothetical protein